MKFPFNLQFLDNTTFEEEDELRWSVVGCGQAMIR